MARRYSRAIASAARRAAPDANHCNRTLRSQCRRFGRASDGGRYARALLDRARATHCARDWRHRAAAHLCQQRSSGIMLAGAARQYLRRYGVALGSRPLIATNNDSAYLLAKDLREAGVAVLGIADTRQHVSDEMDA